MTIKQGKKNLYIAAGTLAFAIGAFLVFKFAMPLLEPKTVATAPEIRALEVVKVTRDTLFRVDQYPGEIQAYQDVAIYPKVPGFVEWIGIDRGSMVNKGDLMVRMFAPEYIARKDEAGAKLAESNARWREAESRLESDRASLLEAKAKWMGDDSTYQRLKAASLVPGVVASNDVIVLGQEVEADMERVKTWENKVQAQANQVNALADAVKAARQSLDNYQAFDSYLELKAPFDGYITKRNMHVGSFSGPLGDGAYPPIARIQQLDLLRIVTPVPERDTHGVIPGTEVEFSVSTFPGRRFIGTVARLGNYLERKTRTMPVELNFFNPELDILPGMFCKVYWPTRRKQTSLFVPTTAVAESTLQTFVCKIEGNRVKWVKVKKGQIMANLIEIFGDLKEGDIVARLGTDELRPETRVKPVVGPSRGANEEARPSYHLPAAS